MDSFDRELIRFVLKWLPYGGPPEEEVFGLYGMTGSKLREAFCRILTTHTPQDHKCDSGDDDLLESASRCAWAKHRKTKSYSRIARTNTERTASAPAAEVCTAKPVEEPVAPVDAGSPKDVPWMRSAHCRGYDTALFFQPDNERGPEARHERVRNAKAVCAQCRVTAECLEHALSRPENHGIWGGLTELERVRIRTQTDSPE